MDKVKIQEIAKEIALKSKDVLDKAKEMGLDVKSVSSTVSVEEAEQILNYITNINTTTTTTPKKPKKEAKVVETPKKSKRVDGVKSESKSSQIEQKVIEDSKEKTLGSPNLKDEKKDEKKSVEINSAKDEIERQKSEDDSSAKDDESSKSLQKDEVIKATKSENEIKTNSENQSETKETSLKSAPSETLAQATMFKKSGITIIRKKNRDDKSKVVETPKKEEKSFSESPKDALSKLNDLDKEALAQKRKKRKEKKASLAPSRKEYEQKIDILSDRPLENHNIKDDDDNEVMMADYHNIVVDEPVEKKIDKDKVKVQNTRQARFIDNTPKRFKKKRKRAPNQTQSLQDQSDIKAIEIPEDIRVYEFADKVNRPISDIIKILFNLGKMITKNDFLDKDDIEILAADLEIEVETSNPLEHLDYESDYDSQENEHLEERAPVVTIMGHVDHGKTSLLDKIRDSRVANGEAGGITQHVGAYCVTKNNKKITFIDTPGHEAFTEMRARGAKVTDIAIIVVAADDGVKPQTLEALDHAKAAEVPMIIAINKIDKPDANIDRVKTQMAEKGYTAVDWGGEYEFVNVSAKSGEGLDSLLETILLQAELMELEANPTKSAKCVVVESSLEKGKGPVATVIVQDGTLQVGDSVVVDTFFGRVRALIDDYGKSIKSAKPSDVAILTGLDGVPPAGSIMVSVESDSVAREYAQKRSEYVRQKELSKTTKVSIDELSALVAEGQLKVLPIVIKADVQGSLEAIKGSLQKLKNDEVRVNIISSNVGGITESDLSLASASENSLILGFNVRPTGFVKEKAKNLGIQVKTYSVIYDLIDDVKAVLGGMMSPIVEEESTGACEVRDTFTISKVGTIAGCIVTEGTIHRGIRVRLIRDGVITYSGNISSLKRFKDDAREVGKGYECGIMLEGYNDIKVGDVFETYKEVERRRESM